MYKNKSEHKILSVNEYLPNEARIKATERFVDFYFPAHGHEFYELELVVDGSAEYTVNKKKYILEKGSLYFVTPADIHKVENTGSPIKLINVQFDENSVAPSFMLSLLKLGGSCCKLDKSSFSYAEKLFLLLLEECGSNEIHKEICLKNYLENILILFLRNNGGNVFETQDETFDMGRVVIFIHSKFREGISLKETAEFSGFSPAYFSVKFHEYSGISFKEYVDRLRFSYSKNLLKSTNLSVTEVCFSSGFKNVSNFTRRFNERYGISPTRYRTED